MGDKIQITGPNRLVIMDIVSGALARQEIKTEIDCEEEFLSCEEISRRLDRNLDWPTIGIEVVKG